MQFAKRMDRSGAEWYENRYDVKLDAETEICSLLGSQEGLAHIAMIVVDEGGLVPELVSAWEMQK